jgi:hypothetical protein
MSGDSEKMVIVGKYTTKNKKYHTRDCCNYPENPRPVPKPAIEDRGFEECDVCSGDIVRTKRHGESLANRLEKMNASDL